MKRILSVFMQSATFMDIVSFTFKRRYTNNVIKIHYKLIFKTFKYRLKSYVKNFVRGM